MIFAVSGVNLNYNYYMGRSAITKPILILFAIPDNYLPLDTAIILSQFQFMNLRRMPHVVVRGHILQAVITREIPSDSLILLEIIDHVIIYCNNSGEEEHYPKIILG